MGNICDRRECSRGKGGESSCGVRLAFSAALCFILQACTVGPDYVKPKIQAPSEFKEAGVWKVSEPRDHLTRGAWWEIFKDPELTALEEQVNISNQNLAVAEANFRRAVAVVQAARAGYFPTVTAGTSATRSRSSGNVGRGPGATTSDYQFAGGASWELDLWGKVRRSVESGTASAQSSAADIESVRLSAQAQLAQDYFQMRTLDAQKAIFDRTIEVYQKFLQLTKDRYSSGIASKSDILQAETQLKNAQAQSTDTGVQRAAMEHAIALLVGKAPSELTIPAKPLTGTPPNMPAGLPSELLERRPDIASAERLVAAANAQIGVAEAAYYPTLTLSASGGFEASKIAQWFAWPSRIWSLGPAMVQQTLFDGGLRRAQTEQAKASYDATVASYRQTVLTAFQEVEDNLAALRILEQEAGIQDEAVNAAKESVEVTRNRYKAGTAGSLDVIVTQAIALNAEITAINIQGRRMASGVLLIQALGGGWNAQDLPAGDRYGQK